MRVTVLGGSAACPNPGQGSSAYLLEIGGQRWLIDCGPDTIAELRKHAEIDELDQILISHVHADHTLDLVPLRYGLKYAPEIERRRIPLWMPPDGRGFLGRVASAFALGGEGTDGFFTDQFDVHEFDPAQPLEINGVTITFHQTNHPVPCWAMRYESPEGTLVYLADTGPQENLAEFARDADILICEGTLPDHYGLEGVYDRPHISAVEAGMIARESKCKRFVLTHLWYTIGFQRYLNAAAEAYGGEVIMAKPGVKVEAE